VCPGGERRTGQFPENYAQAAFYENTRTATGNVHKEINPDELDKRAIAVPKSEKEEVENGKQREVEEREEFGEEKW